LQGRPARLDHAVLHAPGLSELTVWAEGRPTADLADTPSEALAAAQAEQAHGVLNGPAARLHIIALRSPLLLASRSAAREGLQRFGNLPWPSLGSLLDSIAQRLRSLEPQLGRQIGIGGHWSASEATRHILPLTPAHDPARQIQWTYRAAARGASDPRPRSIVLPGIVGTLVYPAGADPIEAALLHWGQWTGAGQKTTLGCGQYHWSTA
jgi:FAD/FMN-containing dehydrogenase